MEKIDLDGEIWLLGLTVRTSNALEARGVKTIRQLIGKTKVRLCGYRGIGESGIADIDATLARYGLKLGTQAEVQVSTTAHAGDWQEVKCTKMPMLSRRDEFAKTIIHAIIRAIPTATNEVIIQQTIGLTVGLIAGLDELDKTSPPANPVE